MHATAMDSSQLESASLSRQAQAVGAYLGDFVASRSLPGNLRAAIRYALLGGGKRLRPILVLRAAQAVGSRSRPAASDAAAMPAAAAIEMVHCFSLAHDDLPAMDDDDLRRGRPTLHRATSEAMAILAGDALAVLPFELIAQKLPPTVAARVALELARATNDMIAGQVYDTIPKFDEAIEPLDRLKTIHQHKTGALIRCGCRMGAIVGGADDNQLAALTRFGEAVGLMFQIVDDLLDVTQTTEHLGKKAGKDADQGKLTYPGVIGVEASKAEVERLASEAYDAVRPFGDAAGPLRELCEYLAVRTR